MANIASPPVEVAPGAVSISKTIFPDRINSADEGD
jgi:hypothetical protein